MQLLLYLSLAFFAAAKVLVKYDAAVDKDVTVLGDPNYDCWSSKDCTQGNPKFNRDHGNDTIHFKPGKDLDGVPAAEVHKDKSFSRAEYHMLNGATEVDKTYYIGYKVRWDATGHGTIVFQFKAFHDPYAKAGHDNVPVDLVFKDDSSILTLMAIQHPDGDNTGKPNEGHDIWSKQLTWGETYQFGIVIDTSQSDGYLQLYFQGKLATLVDPYTQDKTQKLTGNFFPGGEKGAADPKVGLYGGEDKADTAYIYNVVVGDSLNDVKGVAGIA